MDVHVSPTGNDANPGDSGAPLRTVGKAESKAAGGDTIHLHAGVYPEQIKLDHDGASDRPITLRAAGDGLVKIAPNLSAPNPNNSAPDRNRAVTIAADYWTLEGIEIVGGVLVTGTDINIVNDLTREALPGRYVNDPNAAESSLLDVIRARLKKNVTPARGVRITNCPMRKRGVLATFAPHLSIVGCEIQDVLAGVGAGIWINVFSDFHLVRDCYVHDIAETLGAAGTPKAGKGLHYMSEGIRRGQASNYGMVENCRAEKLAGLGRGHTTDVMSNWNTTRKCTARETDQGFSDQARCRGNVWERNLAEGNRRVGYNLNGMGSTLTSATDEAQPVGQIYRCNDSRSNGKEDFSAGAGVQLRFDRNNFALVSLSKNLRGYWKAAKNTWDGSPVAPPEAPTKTDVSQFSTCPGSGYEKPPVQVTVTFNVMSDVAGLMAQDLEAAAKLYPAGASRLGALRSIILGSLPK